MRRWRLAVLQLATLAVAGLCLHNVPTAEAAARPFTLDALQDFFKLFETQLCCQDHVLHKLLPDLETRIVESRRGIIPTRPLVFALVGAAGSGKSHTLHQLAVTVFRGAFIKELMPPSITAAQARAVLARIASAVQWNPNSLVIIEELHHLNADSDGARMLFNFFNQVVKVVAGGKLGGVDYRQATFAFTMNNRAVSGALADILFAKMVNEGLDGPEAIASMLWEDWGPDIEQTFQLQAQTAKRLSFLLKADVMIPFWPLDLECIKCAAKNQLAGLATQKEKAREVKQLRVPNSVLTRMADCQGTDPKVCGGFFPTEGAKVLLHVLNACTTAVGPRFNPESRGWFFNSYLWEEKFVSLELNPKQTPGNKCTNTMRLPMCVAVVKDHEYQHVKRDL